MVHKVNYNNSYWKALFQNLRKAWQRWGVVAEVVMKMGEMVRLRGMIYKEVVHMVMLYGCKKWVVTGYMLKLL